MGYERGICLRKHGTHVGRVSTTVAHKRLLRVQPTLAARSAPTLQLANCSTMFEGSASRIRLTTQSFNVPRVVCLRLFHYLNSHQKNSFDPV